jgi:hypothetical protein
MVVNLAPNQIVPKGTVARLRRSTVMEQRAARYRSKVAECERRTVLANDPTVRAEYADLARQWRELAQQIDGLSNLATTILKSQ